MRAFHWEDESLAILHRDDVWQAAASEDDLPSLTSTHSERYE